MRLASTSIFLTVLYTTGLIPAATKAQQPFFVGGFGNAPGVWLDTDGSVRVREVDEKQQLTVMKVRARAAAEAGKAEKLVYLSLPRLIARVRDLRERHQDIPEELQYLGGMTRLQYVFVFPKDHDLVIAGPAEPWQVIRPGNAGGGGGAPVPAGYEYVVGKRSGRPVMQLDDLIVAIRTAHENGGNLFGCALDPSPDSVQKAEAVERQYFSRPRGERMKAMAEALGRRKSASSGPARTPDWRSGAWRRITS